MSGSWKRSCAAMALGVAALIGVGLGAPAQASPAPALVPAVSAAAKPAPTVSPADVSRTYVANGGVGACPRQYLCALVPYGSGYYYFTFIHCKTYTLSYWDGSGNLENSETGGVTFHLLKQDRSNYFSSNDTTEFDVQWTPVYYVVPC